MDECRFVEAMVHDYLAEEQPEIPIEELLREVDQITRELNDYLARQLIESTQMDEAYHYERYQ